MIDDRVTISIDGGVADVRMNRPEKINAIDDAQFAALVDAGESLKFKEGRSGPCRRVVW
jgi:enoyl-CoA hydratase/carnithine racemase